MYTPRHFSEDDISVLHNLMRDFSFATLISTQKDGLPVASHLPFLLSTEPAPYGTLKAHMALGNSQWRTFDPEREVLVIFQGPHAYITPSWYEGELKVPTWNYATVHAYARPRLITSQAELYEHLHALVATHESAFAEPWPMQLPGDYIERLMKGIVGFALTITRLEGKFKMSQNRPETDRQRIASELQTTGDPTLGAVGESVRGERKR